MILRRRRTPLLLLLLPVLASVVAGEAQDKQVARDAAAPSETFPPVTSLPLPTSTSKPDPGTKDAPVDGLDGKPKQGPFVESPTRPKKPVAHVEDLPYSNAPRVTTNPDGQKEISSDGWKLVEENGVMNDRKRPSPSKGLTGTEGGVSEKTKSKEKEKEKDDAKNKPAEKKPDPPKEAPPLPHSEQERIDAKDPSGKQVATETTTKAKGAVGLEVNPLQVL